MGVIFLLAVSVSLDSLCTGMAYAASGIRIPWSTRFMTAGIGGVLTLAAVVAGDYAADWIPAFWFGMAGGCVLILPGSRMLLDAWKKREIPDYDRDGSHVLEPWEGVVISLSMALDSMSAGFGITECGFARYLFPVFTAGAGVCFLTVGNFCRINTRFIKAAGGSALICLGLFRFFYGI